MKKSIKIWLIVLASLLGLGLVFCMVGAVMGGRLYNAARLMVYGPWGRHIETVVNSDQSDYSYWPSWWDHDYPYYEDFEDYRKEQSQYWQERRDEWRDKAEQERDRWERDWDWDRSDNHYRGEHCHGGYRTAQFTAAVRGANRGSCHTGRYGYGMNGCGGRHWQNSRRWENGGHCSRNSWYRSESFRNGAYENGSSWSAPRFQMNTGSGLVY